MPISGLVIRTNELYTKDVATFIKTCPAATSVDVYKERIVVVTETRHRDEDKMLWKNIENTKGVIQCDLIYHNFEDQEE